MRTATRTMALLCALYSLCALWSTQAQATENPEAARAPAKSTLTIDRGHTALLVMDYQNDIGS